MADEAPAAETVTGTIRRLQAKVEADRATASTTTTTTEEPPAVSEPTPTPKDVAQATGAVSAREAGTFVIIDGLPALLVEHRESISLEYGASLDVWTVTRFTRNGPETIDRHGFLDAAS